MKADVSEIAVYNDVMKKLILLFLVLGYLSGCMISASPSESEGPVSESVSSSKPFTMMVSSDLHFALNEKEINDGIIPQIAYNNEITQALIDQAVREHPDVFILCGDNTNDGKQEDLKILAEMLKEIKDAGIELIAIPGNHDLSSGGRNQFTHAFSGILAKDSEDEATLSYSRTVGSRMFLAMDDNGGSMTAVLPDSTMDWLKQQLNTAKEKQLMPIFISHHSVLTVPSSSSSALYQIQNPDLKTVLKNGGAQLILSGHRHVPIITRRDDMTEIIHAMPDIYPNAVGIYEMDDTMCSYRTESIDVEGTASQRGWTDANLLNFREYSKRATLSYIDSIIEILNRNTDLSAKELTAADDLFQRVYLAYMQGILYEKKEEVLNSPFIDALYVLTDASNFGPWIHQILIETKYSNASAELILKK
ncbi:MAG: hypothetical protein EOM64_08090 [Erysipelotrichia bacterium]|nr:hypothetical protein [Erysipelotrichia bacterium]